MATRWVLGIAEAIRRRFSAAEGGDLRGCGLTAAAGSSLAWEKLGHRMDACAIRDRRGAHLECALP